MQEKKYYILNHYHKQYSSVAVATPLSNPPQPQPFCMNTGVLLLSIRFSCPQSRFQITIIVFMCTKFSRAGLTLKHKCSMAILCILFNLAVVCEVTFILMLHLYILPKLLGL